MPLGTAARRSTAEATRWRSQTGANSERKTATPNASGAATSRASIDDTIVPYIAGAAPKWPATGSQSLDVRNETPNIRNAGQAAMSTATKITSTRIGTSDAKPVIDHE